MILEREYTVKLSEIGRENKATNKAILSYLEDIGGIHSNMAGYGIPNIPDTHLTWLILDWKVQIIRRPDYAETIKVTTWTKPAVKCYSFRDFEVYDKNNNVIIKAISKWVLVDTKDGKIKRIEDSVISKYGPELEKTVFDNEEFEKLKEPENYETECQYTVKRSDIDVNKHMHNLNYIELAINALPEKVYEQEQLDNIRVMYKKEIKLGETVNCKYAFNGEKHIVSIKSEDDSILHAILFLGTL